MNAPESGTIKELLVSEEDTVTVGQDLIKLEPGEAPEGGKQESAPEQPKEAEKPKEESTPAQAEKPKEPAQPSKPAPAPEKKEAPKEAPKTESKPATGGREERRVRIESAEPAKFYAAC